MVNVAKPVFGLISIKSSEGALTSIYCATDNDVVKHSGCYFEYAELKFKSFALQNLYFFNLK
jgi:hypothetical protein